MEAPFASLMSFLAKLMEESLSKENAEEVYRIMEKVQDAVKEKNEKKKAKEEARKEEQEMIRQIHKMTVNLYFTPEMPGYEQSKKEFLSTANATSSATSSATSNTIPNADQKTT